ncbi:erythronate-4-phosphate dehydrogenase [Halomonas sp. BC04]|nr:erythronate-4-phosphate dehydrogenase [Halomonas sp. BC04]
MVAMGIECLACDPPRPSGKVWSEKGSDTSCDLDTLIDECDVLCLHTPLVREGPHATHHLLDAQRIARLEPGTVLLNAGRGDCVDGLALRQRLSGPGDISAVLDVWESEPGIEAALRDLVNLATPHIAGHSLDGKLRGTHQVYEALSRYLGLPVRVTLDALLPAPPLPRLVLDGGLAPEDALRRCLRVVYDVRRDHDALYRESRRRGMAAGFDACRTDYPLRREFATLEVELREGARELAPLLKGMGCRVV